MSLTAHKFYGLNGIGLLIKRRNLALEPLIHGGESTTIYRSGTPLWRWPPRWPVRLISPSLTCPDALAMWQN